MQQENPSDIGIIYFGNDWFAENRTSSHHIARLLTEQYPLLYVESPGLRAPTMGARDIKKLFRKLKASLASPREIGERMWHVTVPQIPFRRFKLFSWVNACFARFIVKRAMRVLRSRRLVSWFVVPHPHALAGLLQEHLTVYYCVDDYASHPGMDVQAVRMMDEDLTRKADLIFAVSQPLVESKRSLNPNTIYSPHGVDAALFARATDPSTIVPDLARGLRHPIIGYYGVIGAWIDVPLLVFLAKSRPQWTFLLIGLISTDVSELRQCPNVTFVGPQPHPTLPNWAKAFDVAIVPMLHNRQVMNANPLKLREYLAAGKPVITVSTPATEVYADGVYLADTHLEFLNGIEHELATDSLERQAKRQALVASSTWEQRVREVNRVVVNALAAKGQQRRIADAIN